MLFWTTARVALRSLSANKLRTALAVLGIIIGVGAVIALLALGAGAKQSVVGQINALGTNLIIIRPGQQGAHGVATGAARQNLTLEDAEAILTQVPGVEQVAPVVNNNAQVKRLGRNTRTNVFGVSVSYYTIRKFEIDSGRFMTEAEVGRGASVTVLGADSVKQLFEEGENPVGQMIKIKGLNFTVVGTLRAKGDHGFFNVDELVVVPYTTAMTILFGLDSLREIDVSGYDGENMDTVVAAISEVLRRRHRTAEGAEDDFSVRSQLEIIERASSVTDIFTLLLGGIASISLLVGGIGIMNIMLVTVIERTREIGIRKAIGAKYRDILSQFLIEAVLISLAGGLLGVLTGIGGAFAISHFWTFPATIEPTSVLLALGFSVGVGVFFGFYPARRAALLNTCTALRYE